MRMRHILPLPATAILIASLLAGCGGYGGSSSSTSTASTTTSASGNAPVCATYALVQSSGAAVKNLDPSTASSTEVKKALANLDKSVQALSAAASAVADRVFGRLDDVLAMWSVEHARDQAWTTAETLVELAGAPLLRSQYLAGLEEMVGFAGRGLLIPTATDL